MAIAPILVFGSMSQKQLVRGLTFGARQIANAGNPAHGDPHAARSAQELSARSTSSRASTWTSRIASSWSRGPVGLRQIDLAAHDRGVVEITSGVPRDRRRAGQRRAPGRAPASPWSSKTYALYRAISVADNMGSACGWPACPRSSATRRCATRRASSSSSRCSTASRRRSRRPAPAGRDRPGECPRAQGACSTSRSPISTPRCACRCGSSSPGSTSLRATMIYVTTTRSRPSAMADKIVVLQAVSSSRPAAPLELYRSPETCSSPADRLAKMNFRRPSVTAVDGGGITVGLAGFDRRSDRADPAGQRPSGDAVTLGIRPEHAEPRRPGPDPGRGGRSPSGSAARPSSTFRSRPS